MKAFKVADQLTLEVYKATRLFPKDEQFGLTSQMRRAAVSAVSNIVEGCSRSSEKDFLRFLEISHGSLRELNYQVTLSYKLGYLSETDFVNLDSISIEASKIMAGLINRIRNDKEER